MGHFLQITIARKTGLFLKKNYRISCDKKLQNRATFCKLRSQEKLDHFPRKTIQFLLITNYRIGQITIARKAKPFFQKYFTISPDRKLQNRVTVCKLRLQEKLDHFSTKTIQFVLITNCRIGPLSANYHRKKNWTISQQNYKFLLITNCRNGPFSANYDRSKNWTTSQEKPYNFC